MDTRSLPTSAAKIIAKNTFQKNVLAQSILVKITKQSLFKQIPSHVLVQTGTNQWQQHDKENALVKLFL